MSGKDYYRKLNLQDQLLKARLLDPDEFKYSEVLDSTCYLLDGYISANGEPPSLEKEAQILGYEVDEHTRLFNQLSKQKLAQRDEKGRLFSPGVLGVLHIRSVRSQAGKAGGGSPLLKQEPKLTDKQKPNYNYSCDSGSVSAYQEGESEGEEGDCSAEFEEFWNIYPLQIEKRAALREWTARIEEGASPADLIAAAEHYADWCAATDKPAEMTKYPKYFLGPDRPFEDFVDGNPGE